MTSRHESPIDVRLLRYVAAILAIVVAGVHVFHPQLGFPRLVLHLQVGTLFDPRPLLFTLSGFAIVAGILLAYNDVARRPIYLAGAVLMLGYLLGYASWHTVLDHGGFWPYIEPHGHHDMGVVETLVDHLLADPVELLSKTAEFVLLVVLLALYRWDVG